LSELAKYSVTRSIAWSLQQLSLFNTACIPALNGRNFAFFSLPDWDILNFVKYGYSV